MSLLAMSSSAGLHANPALIHKGDASRAPLFLLHDAGGTASYYHRLKHIDRTIYAIHNPWFNSPTKWKGGIMGLVEEYIKLIKSVVTMGEILVGGIHSQNS
jgi:thioesterase domain-containing protein